MRSPEPDMVAWEEQGAFAAICSNLLFEPVEGLPAFTQYEATGEDGFPYHVILKCGGFSCRLYNEPVQHGRREA
ncbi:MAG: hypothetical protein JSU89_11115, partial [Myxococcales bacterium]